MAKPPKTPRPQKPPIKPAQEGDFIVAVNMNHEKLIGRVIVAWSNLESVLDRFIWRLLEIEVERGRHLTARMDAVTKIRVARELGKECLDEAQLLILSPILDRIDILRDDRNLITHGIWGRNQKGEQMAFSLRIKPTEPDQIVSQTFPDTRLRNIVHDIDAARFRLMRLERELSASPGK